MNSTTTNGDAIETLHNDIKQLIIEALNLEDLCVADIETNAPLFGDGLGLDSIDALELGLAIKKQYNIVIDADNNDTRQHFESVATLAHYISTQTH